MMFNRRTARYDSVTVSPLKRRRRQLGFSLIEMIVSLGFVAALGGLIATSTFQTFRSERDSSARIQMATETTRSSRWLIRDIHRAATTDLIAGGGPVNTASLSWQDSGGTAHTCVYDLDGTNLRRTCDGVPANVAETISGLTFVRVGDLINTTSVVTPDRRTDLAETISMNVALGAG